MNTHKSREHRIDSNAVTDIASNSSIEDLLRGNSKLWRGCDMTGGGLPGQNLCGRSTGFSELDNILPGRGWPDSGLMEVISPYWGMGELQLLIPLMRSVVAQGKWILWISPPYQLYAPALVQAGINTEQILVIGSDTSCKDALWSMEKALQSEDCGLVLAWQNWLPGKVLRRLQLAAETGDSLGVLFKHHDSEHSPSCIRLQIKDSSSDSSSQERNSQVTLIKARGNFRPLTAE